MARCPLLILLALLVVGCMQPTADAVAEPVPLFSDAERAAIVAYWNAPGRYTVAPSPDVWLTPAARAWIDATRPRLGWRERTQLDVWVKRRQVFESAAAAGQSAPEPEAPPASWGSPPLPLHAPERVGITPGGSAWHHQYNTLLAQAGTRRDPTIRYEPAVWEDWIKKRIAYDKGVVGGGPAAPEPGPCPASLAAALGEPPALFARYRPQRYTVTLAAGDALAPFVYTEHNNFPDRYIYYRSATGVMRVGRRLSSYEGVERQRIDDLFRKVGGSDFERRVLTAVSRLEGGFEAVNTYDTGFISIGFIQFISARDGNGSLAEVLLRHKTEDPEDFQQTFRRFGIDVAPERVLVAVDPATGAELRGADAVTRIIEDKRLTAVFERAGGTDGFRIAQLRVARARYWPGDDPVSVPVTVVLEQAAGQSSPLEVEVVPGPATAAVSLSVAARQAERRKADPLYRCWTETRTLTARVADLVKSEAGMATLMDRKVQRGNIRNLSDVVGALMRQHSVTRLEDLTPLERTLVEQMRHRADFLSDKTLTQPVEPVDQVPMARM